MEKMDKKAAREYARTMELPVDTVVPPERSWSGYTEAYLDHDRATALLAEAGIVDAAREAAMDVLQERLDAMADEIDGVKRERFDKWKLRYIQEGPEGWGVSPAAPEPGADAVASDPSPRM